MSYKVAITMVEGSSKSAAVVVVVVVVVMGSYRARSAFSALLFCRASWAEAYEGGGGVAAVMVVVMVELARWRSCRWRWRWRWRRWRWRWCRVVVVVVGGRGGRGGDLNTCSSAPSWFFTTALAGPAFAALAAARLVFTATFLVAMAEMRTSSTELTPATTYTAMGGIRVLFFLVSSFFGARILQNGWAIRLTICK